MLRVCLLLAIAHDLDLKSINFVLAFPLAEINIDMWMEFPEGMDLLGSKNNQHKYVSMD